MLQWQIWTILIIFSSNFSSSSLAHSGCRSRCFLNGDCVDTGPGRYPTGISGYRPANLGHYGRGRKGNSGLTYRTGASQRFQFNDPSITNNVDFNENGLTFTQFMEDYHDEANQGPNLQCRPGFTLIDGKCKRALSVTLPIGKALWGQTFDDTPYKFFDDEDTNSDEAPVFPKRKRRLGRKY